jgi:hypothetical protein
MEENIIFNTEVKTGKSVESVKSVRTELRALTQELATLEPKSEAFTKAAIRAGELRDKMDDAQMAIKAFNPEAKFQAFANVIGGVANGFAAAQGAIALFGSESEDLNKVLVKTQGAIALATGLKGILGMKDQLQVMALVIKTNVVSAFATMRAAIISTGILGLVVLIGTLIYNWYEEKKANDEATAALVKYNEESQRIADEERKTAINKMEGRQRELTDIQNKANEEVAALYKKEKAKEITMREANETAKQIIERLEDDVQRIKDKYRAEDAKKAKEARDKRRDELKAQSDWEDENIREGNAKIQEDKDKESARDKERLESLRVARREAAAEDIRLNEEAAKAKIDSLNMTADALAGFAALAGQETAAGKALAIATTTIDTYVAAQAAFKSGSAINPALGYIAAAGALAAGFARVRAIMAVKVPAYSGSGPSMSMGGNVAPPIVRPTSSAVQITNGNPIRTNNQGADQRVYVLESDITNSQNKVNSIRTKATIK